MMKYTIKFLLALCTCFSCSSSFCYAQKEQTRYKLNYDKPSSNWNEALPIGNGFLGAMVFGGKQTERLQLNETTIWGGGPNNNIDAEAKPAIEEVRALLNQKSM